jgi:ribosome-binding protein aMBF1 (putative translation factor)
MNEASGLLIAQPGRLYHEMEDEVKSTTYKMLISRLKDRRECRGWSQHALADVMNTSQSCISAWENGKTEPCLTNLIRWANALGLYVSLEDIL